MYILVGYIATRKLCIRAKLRYTPELLCFVLFMKNKILSIFSNTIPYVKELRECTDSVTAAILMQQLDYWFARKPQGFYKFSEPPKSDNPKYNDGDSWTEELGFSADELRTAFSKIGVAYKSKTEFKKALETNTVFQSEDKEFFYARYFDRDKGCSFYYRNDKLVDAILDKLVSLETDDADLRETEDVGLPIPLETEDVGLRETEDAKLHVLYREHSTETTSSDTLFAVKPQLALVKDITLPITDLKTLNSKEDVLMALGKLVPLTIEADKYLSTLTTKDVADFKRDCKKHKNACTCLHPYETLPYKIMNEITNILSSGAVDWGREGKHSTKLIRSLITLKYTMEDIIYCMAWAYQTDQFSYYATSSTSVSKLMPKFLDLRRTGKLKDSLSLKPKESANDRNWKELQKHKEEILKNASNASQQLNTKHGITAKPRI